MKYFLLLVALITGHVACAYAQDRIVTKDGDVINAFGVDVGESSIYYKLENADNAPLKSIAKDNVLMIKRQDGTKVNLYENTAASSSTGKQQNVPRSSQRQVGAESEEATQRNEAVVREFNDINPEFTGEKGKKAGKVFCLFGLGGNSKLTNDDVDVEAEMGSYAYRQGVRKQDLASTISKHADNERGDLTFKAVKETETFGNPALLVRLKNKSGRTIYVDLGNSYFVRNGMASAYYVPTSSTSGSMGGSGVGVNMGAVAGALGVGGAIGTLAGGVTVGDGSGTSTANTVYSQRVISIPPASTAVLDPQLLFKSSGKFCDGLDIKPYGNGSWVPSLYLDKDDDGSAFKTGEIIDYTENASPVKFNVFVSYSFDEACSNPSNVSAYYYVRRIIGAPLNNSNSDWYSSFKKNMSGFQKCMGFACVLYGSKKGGDAFPR